MIFVSISYALHCGPSIRHNLLYHMTHSNTVSVVFRGFGQIENFSGKNRIFRAKVGLPPQKLVLPYAYVPGAEPRRGCLGLAGLGAKGLTWAVRKACFCLCLGPGQARRAPREAAAWGGGAWVTVLVLRRPKFGVR